MLLNAQSENEYQSAADMHVTPQEFAQAVSAAENQKMQPGNTIRLGEAIDQLEIPLTPEELRPHIQAVRNASMISPTATKKRKHSWILYLMMSFGGLALAFPLLIIFLFMISSARNQSYSPPMMPVEATVTEKSPSETEIPFIEVGNNTPVYASIDTLHELANGTSPAKLKVISQADSYMAGSRQWQLIKLNGHTYVRGAGNPRSGIVCSKVNGELKTSVLIPIKAFAKFPIASWYRSAKENSESSGDEVKPDGTGESIEQVNLPPFGTP